MTDPSSSSGPVVRVSSHGRVEVPADQAELSLQLTSPVRRVREDALAEVHAQRAQVQQVLDDHADSIRRTAFGRSSVYEQKLDNSQLRWRAQLHLEVELADIAAVAVLYNDLRRLAPESLSGPHWSLSDDHPAHAEARAVAIRAAIDRAREMAAAAGTEVIALDWLADSDAKAGSTSYHSLRVGAVGGMGDDDAYGDDLDFEPAPQIVTASVTAQYRIAPVNYRG